MTYDEYSIMQKFTTHDIFAEHRLQNWCKQNMSSTDSDSIKSSTDDLDINDEGVIDSGHFCTNPDATPKDSSTSATNNIVTPQESVTNTD